MKKTITLFSIFMSVFCYSQKIISLTDYEKCLNKYADDSSVECLKEEVEYIKDVDRRLDIFEGTWTGKYNNKTFKLQLVKKLKFGEYNPKADRLLGKLKVSTPTKELFNSYNLTGENSNPYGVRFIKGTYSMLFQAESCQDFGRLYLRLNPNNPNEMSMIYGKEIGYCPDIKNYDYLIPNKRVILVRED
ncbi:hypothetical protein EDM00_08955 [Ornithobacterium rhinotracheale]|uniref:DUF6705 family protein n=1 Tax=Ornithobacterium rhinotracheale TaxID=28251 RepID=UPI00129CFF03|nr:DUF6705 family protein [Ornithobacterium rhinotracheale]MRI64115.1 hypothetical protein [Ornithobacterium rhinotracheale]